MGHMLVLPALLALFIAGFPNDGLMDYLGSTHLIDSRTNVLYSAQHIRSVGNYHD